MFERPRSPGSTLKPLLYALAIDRGLALPEYLVADVPMQYGTYRPRNFDGDWAGLVTLQRRARAARSTCRSSICSNSSVSRRSSASSARMGVARRRGEPGDYGLSLIVGGIEVTPLELAGLYATLAEDGAYVPLRLRRRSDLPRPPADLRPRRRVADARRRCRIKDRPDFPRRRDVNGVPAEIHWKTGTSFGFRDAWAVGSGPTYTAVVWTGNVDRQAERRPRRIRGRGPAVVRRARGRSPIARTYRRRTSRRRISSYVEVCAYSGHISQAMRAITASRCSRRSTRCRPRRVRITRPTTSSADGPCGGAGVPPSGRELRAQELRRAAERGDGVARRARARHPRDAGVRRRIARAIRPVRRLRW